MFHWLSEHGAAFADIRLIWLAPAQLVVIASRLLRKDFRGYEGYAAYVAPSTVGRLPNAFDHPRLGLVDALVMYRTL